jgi:2-dehydrotetronate isomerase
MAERDGVLKAVRFAANIGFLYQELPFVERIAAAARNGFHAVECHWPFEFSRSQILSAIQESGIPMIGLNTAPGDLSRGYFGLSALPEMRAEARDAIEQATTYCSALGVQNLHVMAGNTDRSELAERTFRDNLQFACDRADAHCLTILIEPLNDIDHPAYHLVSTAHAAEIISVINRPNLKMMFDLHHVRRAGDDVIASFDEIRDLIGHIQISGEQERGEPGQSELDFLRHVDQSLGHRRPIWIGAEYMPKTESAETGAGWLSNLKDAFIVGS